MVVVVVVVVEINKLISQITQHSQLSPLSSLVTNDKVQRHIYYRLPRYATIRYMILA